MSAYHIRKFVAVLSWATVILLPLTAEAKILYVSPTGNDAVTYANNGPTNPWRSIGRAAWGTPTRNSLDPSQAARAGDVVRIAGGTYATAGVTYGGGAARQDVAYNPANNGTAGSPIRFECTDACVLTFSSGSGPMIGALERNYIEWSGFTISESSAPTLSDTGPVTFFRSTGGSVENSTLTGNPAWSSREGDNYNGVRLEDSSGVRIFNNRIINYGGQTGGSGVNNDRNHSGITTYRSYALVIENNEIVNCASGIYLKGTSPTSVIQSSVVRFNIFRNNRWGLHALQTPYTSSQPLLVYQNVFIANREAGMWINAFNNSQYDAKWVRFFNNTLVDNVSAIGTYNWATFPLDANFLFWNNIMAGSGNRLRQDTAEAVANNLKSVHDFNRNVYSTAQFEIGGTSRTFAYLQGLGQDLNSIVSNPGFMGATDYRLTAGSVARTVGRAVYGIGGANGTVIPAGAYITGNEIIGPGSSSNPPPTLPTTPTGLRITPGS